MEEKERYSMGGEREGVGGLVKAYHIAQLRLLCNVHDPNLRNSLLNVSSTVSIYIPVYACSLDDGDHRTRVEARTTMCFSKATTS